MAKFEIIMHLSPTPVRRSERPRVKIDVDNGIGDDGEHLVCMTLPEEMGQPIRFVELTILQAREMATALMSVAAAADSGDYDGEDEEEEETV